MKEFSVIYSSEMIQAILDGRKTQDRVVINPQPPSWVGCYNYEYKGQHFFCEFDRDDDMMRHWPDIYKGLKSPWKIGDRIWAKETWAWPGEEFVIYKANPESANIVKMWKENPNYPQVKWKSPVQMPRWASRITPEITNVRVERLQDISEEDAKAEGTWNHDWEDPRVEQDYSLCPRCGGTGLYMGGGLEGAVFDLDCMDCVTFKQRFSSHWNSRNEKKGHGWDKNKWVWVREYKRIEI